MTLKTWNELTKKTPADLTEAASRRAADQALVDRLTADHQRIADEIAQAKARMAEYDAAAGHDAP